MTLQEHDDRIREDALKEGCMKGIKEGKIKVLAELCRDGVLAPEEGARKAEMTVEKFQRAVVEMAE